MPQIPGRQRIGLVACCKGKRNILACAAEDLYVSPLFRFASAYCKQTYDRWFILSAKYGLVCPSQQIGIYDTTLLAMGSRARKEWGHTVAEQIRRKGLTDELFFLHAGRVYCNPLADQLECLFPMSGLPIGKQLAWYKERGIQCR